MFTTDLTKFKENFIGPRTAKSAQRQRRKPRKVGRDKGVQQSNRLNCFGRPLHIQARCERRRLRLGRRLTGIGS
ncbi:MAG TPA: hypothetical protein VHB99_06610, partial [Pirellulales bacterium]|nr:hypothetical protein [Pirellulales bacterium]